MNRFYKKLHIVFVLPGWSRTAAGGPKMVFEYANRLTERGHKVDVAFDAEHFAEKHFDWVPRLIRKLGARFFIAHSPTWFHLHREVGKICALGIKDSEMPDADVVIATAVETANPISKLSNAKGKKYYFIQDYENWNGWTDEMVDATYHLGMINVTVANWLVNKILASGAESVLIRNGIDFQIFNIDVPIESRIPHSIAMMYRDPIQEPHKGSYFGLQAIYRLKHLYPDLSVTLFGVLKRPDDLPAWIKYVQRANQSQLREIYNNAAVYLYPAVLEGFGLTGAEAMACGCAYVCSDYGGQREYTVEGRNVLLSEPKNIEALVANTKMLFDDQELRIALARQGYEDIQFLDWNESVKKMESLLTGVLS